jgi:glycosyltransferase involved in cell wall biosynthesis
MPNRRKLRICFVTQEFPPFTNWGGVGVQFDNLARALADDGHGVVVISRRGAGAPEYQRLESGVEVWRVGVPLHRKLLVGRTVDRILHARAVAKLVRRLDQDEAFDVLESPEAGLDGEALAMDAAFQGRLIICCHGTNRKGQAVGGPLGPLHDIDWNWSFIREQRFLRRARRVVAASDATKGILLEQGIDDQMIDVVPLGIDVNRFSPTSADGRLPGPLRVGFVGRLQQSKGIDFLWRLMEKVSPSEGIRFEFKGAIHPSTRRDTVRRLDRHSAVAGYHPPAAAGDMPGFYRSLDALLLPSRFENFGLTYAEAMASGLLVFAGKFGGGPEIVSDGVNGFIVDPDGPVEPVLSRLRQMATDRGVFAEVRRRARADVVRRYSVERFASEKLTQYWGIVEGEAGGPHGPGQVGR